MVEPGGGRGVVAPFGIRLWDEAAARPVSDGLRVTAAPKEGGGGETAAFCTPSGLFTFRGLPGFREVEYPREQDPAQRGKLQGSLVIRVEDSRGHYLPCAFLFEEELPLASGIYRTGIFDPLFPAEPSGSPALRLFSSPARPVLPGMAVVRAQLLQGKEKVAASHAVVGVTVAGKRYFGLSDLRGEMMVMFPYPPVDLAAPVPVLGRSWEGGVEVRYAPGSLTTLPAAAGRGSPDQAPPELGSVLRQGAARIRTDPATPGAAENITCTLVYGRELVLRTGSEPQLLVDAP